MTGRSTEVPLLTVRSLILAALLDLLEEAALGGFLWTCWPPPHPTHTAKVFKFVFGNLSSLYVEERREHTAIIFISFKSEIQTETGKTQLQLVTITEQAPTPSFCRFVVIVVFWCPCFVVVVFWCPCFVLMLLCPCFVVVVFWCPCFVVVFWCPCFVLVVFWCPCFVLVVFWCPCFVVVFWCPCFVVVVLVFLTGKNDLSEHTSPLFVAKTTWVQPSRARCRS